MSTAAVEANRETRKPRAADEVPSYAEYRETGIPWIGRAPTHWSVDRLRWTISTCQNGIWGEEPDGLNDIACVRVADFDRTALRVVREVPTLRAVTRTERRGRLLRRGDLLLEKSGGGELQPVGVLVGYDLDAAAVCSNFVARVGIAPGFDSRFLVYLHAHLYAGRVNTRSIKQTTGIQNLDSMAYFDERACWPPQEEQIAIAAWLDDRTKRIDELVEAKRRLIDLLGEQRTAVITDSVTKGLDPHAPMKPSGFDWLGDVPQHWKMTKLRYITSMRGGSTPSKAEGAFWNGEIPWVSPKDMKRDEITDAEDHVTPLALADTGLELLMPPLVLMVVRGMILLHSFPVALATVPVTINQDMKAISPCGRVDAQFLMLLLRGLKDAMMALIDEAGHGTRVLRTELWKGVRVFLPPFEEQQAIVAHLRAATAKLDTLTATTEAAIERLTEYRQALITAAVTGKIDVRKGATA